MDGFHFTLCQWQKFGQFSNSILTPATSELPIVLIITKKCWPKWHPWWTWWVMETRLCRCFQYLPPKKKDEKKSWIDHFFRSTSRSWQWGGTRFSSTFPGDPFVVQVLQCFSVWPKCLGWGLELEICWSRVKGQGPWLEELVCQMFSNLQVGSNVLAATCP